MATKKTNAKPAPKGKLKPFFKKVGLFIAKSVLYFFLFSVLLTLVYRFVNPPITWLMFQRWTFEGYSLDKDWVDIDELPSYVPMAMVTAEDQKFFQHNGFDFQAIEKAMKYNEKKAGKKIKGGSTISQQTAKNVFCWPQRSWVRKGFETYFTFLIEMLWPKKRILEVYINVVELGQGVYGVEAASQRFWNKPSDRISRNQAALLAAVLPRPLKYNAQRPGAYVQRRASRIARQIGNFPAVYLQKEN